MPGCGPVVVNAGQSGYYRTLYAPTSSSRRCATASRRSPPIDQLGLVDDAWALGLAGLQPIVDVLELVQRDAGDADPRSGAASPSG